MRHVERDDAEHVLRERREAVDRYLTDDVPRLCGFAIAPRRAIEPVEYALAGQGKRVRAALVLESCHACGHDARDALPAAAAVELVHVFSLVHDDLPAMDDDDLRRGRPTVHRQFDDAAAVLAGDALSLHAFETLARGYADRPGVGLACVAELARASGVVGMVGGQALDIAAEGRRLTLDELRDVHDRKTGALLAASCALGGLVAEASPGQVDRLRRFGRNVGLAFQIADDLLDVTATSQAMGKATGKDAGAGKNTYPELLGVDASRRLASETVDAALAELDGLPNADGLRALARFAADRGR